MAKRKTLSVEPPVITQVVEEVVDEKPAEVLEEIKEDAKNIEEAVEKLEDAIPVEALPVSEPEVETKEREVISELYKPKTMEIPSEVIADSRTSVKSILVWSLVVIGIALLTGGILLLTVKSFQGKPSVVAPTPTVAVPQETPTPVTAKREDVKVQVLNGGGVAGSGSKMKTLLEEKGYTVEDVKNADEFTYLETEVHVKADKVAYLELLKTDLAESYTVGTADASLSADSLYDVQVIVGKK